MQQGIAERVRIDKWLWAARFYKTRSLATQAVEGGQIKLNGERVKPAKEIKAGDTLEITLPDAPRVVVVRGLSDKRGPAPAAQQLYDETPESLAARERRRQERALRAEPAADLHGRPTKQDRRRMDSVRWRRDD